MLRNIDRAMRLQELDSQQVRELQQELGGLVVDGVMGPRTEARWKEWKKANNQAEPNLIGPGSVRLLLSDEEVMTRGEYDLALAPASKKDRDRYYRPLMAAMEECNIKGPARMAMFLAQLMHESGNLRYDEEIWGPTPIQRGYEGRRDLGNIKVGDGRRFRGRGLFQLTGRANYQNMGNMLGLPLVDNPELAREPINSARIAAHYWRTRGLNEIADKNDINAFRQVTRRINGGLIGLSDRLEHWKRIQAVLT